METIALAFRRDFPVDSRKLRAERTPTENTVTKWRLVVTDLSLVKSNGTATMLSFVIASTRRQYSASSYQKTWRSSRGPTCDHVSLWTAKELNSLNRPG